MSQNFQTTATLPALSATREQFYELVRTANPLVALVDTGTMDVLNNKLTTGARVPVFRKVTMTYLDLAAGAGLFDIELFQLPAGAQIHAMKMKHSVAFTGGAISAYTLSVGIVGTLAKYMAAGNVFVAPSATGARVVWAPFFNSLLPPAFVNADNTIGALAVGAAYNQGEVTAVRNACEVLADDCRALRAAIAALYAGANGFESQSAATSIRLAAAATGANTNAATAGSVDVWTLYSVEI